MPVPPGLRRSPLCRYRRRSGRGWHDRQRHTALRLGLVASAVALSGRGTARAADALSIGPAGVNIDNLDVAKGLRVSGPIKIDGKNTLEFGAGISGKQGDAGKIGYQTYSDDLDIVGAGTDATNRKIKFWAEGGALLSGGLTVTQSMTVQDVATLNKSLTVAGADGAKSFRVSPLAAGANMLDVQAAARTKVAVAASAGTPAWNGDHPTDLALYVSATSDSDGKGVEFRHSNGSQGIGFGFNTIYATGKHPNQDLILKARGTGSVKIGAQSLSQPLSVPVGEEPLRMLRGIVNPAGTKVVGEGFSATRVGTGLYDIVFSSASPAVTGIHLFSPRPEQP